MKGKTTLRKDGTTDVELLEHSTLDEEAVGHLKSLLALPNLPDEFYSTLHAIRLLALHSQSAAPELALREALTVIALAAEAALLLADSRSRGTTTRNDFARIIHAALEALSGRAMTAREGFRVPEGEWSIRVVRVLDESAPQFAAADEAEREQIVMQAQNKILEISGREPSTKLVGEALAPRKGRRPKGAKLPTRLTSYQALLVAVGLERPTETALARMRSRYKGKLTF